MHVPLPRRMVVQERDGVLTLYYGDKEVAFDDPALFGFARNLAQPTGFTLAEAQSWAPAIDPDQIEDYLATLVSEGIVQHGAAPDTTLGPRLRPAPLPQGASGPGQSWANQAGAIGQALLGEPIHPAHLELVIPVFRLAHPALDADDRQVGEANVFPRPLRLDRPTEWQVCTYSGTRHQADRPMNVTALRAMRAHWPEMMAALGHIRSAYLTRCGLTGTTLTLGQIERLAVAVLAVPTWALMRPQGAVPNGQLDPALSSLFRVTDGLRMAAHQMMFVPVGEPVTPPDAVVTAAQMHDFAERAMSFHSETGVCAGPSQFVAEFLSVLIDGKPPVLGAGGQLDPGMTAALADLDAAMDYGFEALAIHAAAFSFWPKMGTAYALLDRTAQGLAPGLSPEVDRFRAGMAGLAAQMAQHTHIGRADWRDSRLAAYADMYAQGQTLARLTETPSLPLTLPLALDLAYQAESPVVQMLHRAVQSALPGLGDSQSAEIAATLAEFAFQTRAVLRVACGDQARLAQRLGRPTARAFTARDLTLHTRLQGASAQRLPFLPDAMADLLGLHLAIYPDHIRVALHAPLAPHSPDQPGDNRAYRA